VKYLIAGGETKKGVKLLIAFTKITSEPLCDAIYAHLCQGYSVSGAATLNDVKQQHVGRAIDSLNEIARKVEDVKNYHKEQMNIT
tara:strand:+ start:51 stop:305 length:255 start_codon:yes stop_codon:yes gene_type:complete